MTVEQEAPENDVNDERLQEHINSNPILNAVYQMYRSGNLHYEEMLIHMICELSRHQSTMTKEFTRHLERTSLPLIVF